MSSHEGRRDNSEDCEEGLHFQNSLAEEDQGGEEMTALASCLLSDSRANDLLAC